MKCPNSWTITTAPNPSNTSSALPKKPMFRAIKRSTGTIITAIKNIRKYLPEKIVGFDIKTSPK
jgi:hypothetical protein